MREIKFEYGFESVNGIVKKHYYLHEIPSIEKKCDVWNVLPLLYVRQFTGLKDVYDGDRILLSIKFFESNAAWSESGFAGVVHFDEYKWKIKDIDFTKRHDQEYVFRMQGRKFDRDLLDKYCSIRNADFDEISEYQPLEVISSIHEHKHLLK